MKHVLVCLVVGGLWCPALAGHFQTTVDVQNAIVSGAIGDPGNTVIALSGEGIQEYVQVSAIGWDVSLLTLGDSWFSDVRVRVSNGDGDFFDIAPGPGDDSGGIGGYSSNGLISVVDSGDAFFVGFDHTVYLEFFDSFDQQNGVFGVPDALVLDGSITIGTRVPAPGVLGLFAAGGLLASRRRR